MPAVISDSFAAGELEPVFAEVESDHLRIGPQLRNSSRHPVGQQSNSARGGVTKYRVVADLLVVKTESAVDHRL